MINKSKIDPIYFKTIVNNPDKKFVLYIRVHHSDINEVSLLNKLESIFGNYKEIPEERLVIFIVTGNLISNFINILDASQTEMYLSSIQIVDELKEMFDSQTLKKRKNKNMIN